MIRVLVPLFVAFGFAALGCSSTSESSGGNEVDACNDHADAVAKAAKRCGQDYEANRQAFIKNAAMGDCANITVREMKQLRNTCIPSFDEIECSDLRAGKNDSSCASQLQYR